VRAGRVLRGSAPRLVGEPILRRNGPAVFGEQYRICQIGMLAGTAPGTSAGDAGDDAPGADQSASGLSRLMSTRTPGPIVAAIVIFLM
jgi:hypothetical protein